MDRNSKQWSVPKEIQYIAVHTTVQFKSGLLTDLSVKELGNNTTTNTLAPTSASILSGKLVYHGNHDPC